MRLTEEPVGCPCKALALRFIYPTPHPWLCPGQTELTGYSSHLAQVRPWNPLLLLRNKTQASCEGYPITPVLGTTLEGVLSSARRRLSSWPAKAKGGREKTLGHQAFPRGGGKMKVSGLGCKKQSGPVCRPGLLGKETALSVEAQQGSQPAGLYREGIEGIIWP